MTLPFHSLSITRSAVSAISLCATLMVAASPWASLAAEPRHANSQVSARASNDEPSLERGHYLAKIGGCHDCHTPGYAQSAGAVPPEQWLTGSDIGFKGPWGVSYPTNLRLTVQSLTEEQWLVHARSRRLPPMPWFVLRDMTDTDVRALYRFFRSLGPAGVRAPLPLAPTQPVTTPFIDFTPQSPKSAAKQ